MKPIEKKPTPETVLSSEALKANSSFAKPLFCIPTLLHTSNQCMSSLKKVQFAAQTDNPCCVTQKHF